MCGIWDWQSTIVKDLNDSQDPKHTLFCRENAFVAIYALFSDNKCPLFTCLGGGSPKADIVHFFYRFSHRKASLSGSCSLKKANLSRMRRREKRAADRAAAENAAAASAAAAAVKEAETTAVKGAVKTAAAEIAAPESAATDIAAENAQDYDNEETSVDESGALEGASTSRFPAPSSRSEGERLVLPLCH